MPNAPIIINNSLIDYFMYNNIIVGWTIHISICVQIAKTETALTLTNVVSLRAFTNFYILFDSMPYYRGLLHRHCKRWVNVF